MKTRFSAKRDALLNTLKKTRGALTAQQLHTLHPNMDPTTVYRNLERFVSEGTVKKITLGGTSALYEYGSDTHHHAVCKNCDDVIHFNIQKDQLEKIIEIKDFAISDVEVIVRGTHC